MTLADIEKQSLLEQNTSEKDTSTLSKGKTDGKSTIGMYKLAVKRTFICILASIVFGLCLYFSVSPEVSQEFFAGWLLEQSLSIDNVLVFLLLFDYFKVPLENQDRVLKYGIIGAMIMRAVMIGLGSVALHHFQAVQLIFAGILIYSSASVLLSKLYNTLGGYVEANDDKEDMSKNQVVRLSKQLFHVTDKFDGDKFFVFIDGKRKATPLLICMISIEFSDVIFAVDSVPAVFGVTNVSYPLRLFLK